MPDSISRSILREIEPLHAGDTIGYATRRVIDADLPALPVVDERGRFKGIFGEREFAAAVFPGYVGTLSSARAISAKLEGTIEWRLSCKDEPIDRYLTTDAVLVEDDFSDIQLAEIFLHHRVLIVPVATKGTVHAVVTRKEFFHALAERVLEEMEDFAD